VEVIDRGGRRYSVARASESDVPALAALLTDDVLGAQRESTDVGPYLVAFGEIDRDPNHLLLAIRDEEGNLVGTMQLTLIPGLARAGAKRLQIEGVRLAASTRGSGLGTALFEWAHQYGRRQGAVLAQLTTDKTRTAAHRFYDRLGYQASHEGYKRPL
jgi:GNAT superfamily N-acetyltransferase